VPLSKTLAGAGFTNTGYGSSTTLLQALGFSGNSSLQGAKNLLLRAAAAAYLNSLTVNYPLSTSQVVSQVNAALASNNRNTILSLAETLDGFNSKSCPLG
jgi:hypothetical protein